jgi:hypothetical protein
MNTMDVEIGIAHKISAERPVTGTRFTEQFYLLRKNRFAR